VQIVRPPGEILTGAGDGTCLDLALLFAGVALGKELLPLVVVLEGHALVAVSRTTERRKASSSERQRAEGDWTYEGLLTDSAKLRQMVDQRRYVLVECTGFAISDTALSEMLPEGRGRVGGRLSWEEAVRAGREQLTQVNRPLRFAVDVAVLQDYSHFKPLDPLGDGLASLQQDLRLLMDITALTSPRRQRRPLTEVAIDARIKDLVDRVISTTQDLPDTKMRVRWKATSEAAAAMSALTSEAHTAYREAVDASSSSGDFRELFDRAPSQRVIVLGSAGAGKSFLAQAIARSLATAGKGRLPNRVPVQVSAAKWDPTRSLRDEIAQQAAPEGSSLAERCRDWSGKLVTYAQALVDQQRVLPIIDGLDEMPQWLRPRAVEEILKYRGPLLVTSRTTEYLDAVSRVPVYAHPEWEPRPWVVELRPLTVSDIKDYLDGTSARGWSAVVDRVENEPAWPLSEVLTNPLMLWTARKVYGDKPNKLEQRSRYTTRATIERQLFNDFLDATYNSNHEPSRYNPQEAQRWLRFLAGEFLDRGAEGKSLEQPILGRPARISTTIDIAWWRLHRTVRRWQVISAVVRTALLMALIGALLIWLLKEHVDSLTGIYIAFRDALLGGPVGRVIQPTVDHLFALLPQNIRTALQAPVVGLYHQVWALQISSGRLLAVLVPLTGFWLFALYERLYEWEYTPQRLDFRRRRSAVRAVFNFVKVAALTSVALAVAVGLLDGSFRAFFGEPSTWSAVLTISLLGSTPSSSSFATKIDTAGGISPKEALALDRHADIVLTAYRRGIFAVIIGLLCVPQIVIAYLAFAFAATVLALTMGGQGASASRSYVDAKFWLACRRRLPWRAVNFLDHASRPQRGVLRQVGAVYQFRHLRLQEALRNPWEHRPAASERRRFRRKKGLDRLRRWLGKDNSLVALTKKTGSPAALNNTVGSEQELALDEQSVLQSLDIAQTLSDMGRHEEAQLLLADCVDTYGGLATENRALLLKQAGVLVFLAETYYRMGWREDWIATINDALRICRELIETDQADEQSDLIELVGRIGSGRFDGLAWHRYELERADRATITRAADAYRMLSEIYCALSEANATSFREDLVRSLSDLSTVLVALRRWQEALAPTREATRLLRELIERQHAASKSRQAPGETTRNPQQRWSWGLSPDDLIPLIHRLWKLGHRDEALEASNTIRKVIETNHLLSTPTRRQSLFSRCEVLIRGFRYRLRNLEKRLDATPHWIRKVADAFLTAEIRASLRTIPKFPQDARELKPSGADVLYCIFETRKCCSQVNHHTKSLKRLDGKTRDKDAWHKRTLARTALINSLDALAEAQRKMGDAWDEFACQWAVLEISEQALIAIEETLNSYCQAARTYCRLNKENQENSLRELAESLDLLSCHLGMSGREKEARKVRDQAAEARRKSRALAPEVTADSR
jgi:tetratricopeptide (TPR) repeat protein